MHSCLDCSAGNHSCAFVRVMLVVVACGSSRDVDSEAQPCQARKPHLVFWATGGNLRPVRGTKKQKFTGLQASCSQAQVSRLGQRFHQPVNPASRQHKKSARMPRLAPTAEFNHLARIGILNQVAARSNDDLSIPCLETDKVDHAPKLRL